MFESPHNSRPVKMTDFLSLRLTTLIQLPNDDYSDSTPKSREPNCARRPHTCNRELVHLLLRPSEWNIRRDTIGEPAENGQLCKHTNTESRISRTVQSPYGRIRQSPNHGRCYGQPQERSHLG